MATDRDDDNGPSFPAGTFHARAEWQSVSLGWNKEKTAERISVRMRVTDEFQSVLGKSITWYGGFATQGNIDFAIKAMTAMGWDGVSPIGKPGAETGALCGLGSVDCEIVVVHREWYGKIKAEVQYVNPLSGMGFKDALDDRALGSLNERIKRHMGATAPRPQQQRPPVTRPPPQAKAIAAGNHPPAQQRNAPALPTYPTREHDSDDIPF